MSASQSKLVDSSADVEGAAKAVSNELAASIRRRQEAVAEKRRRAAQRLRGRRKLS